MPSLPDLFVSYKNVSPPAELVWDGEPAVRPQLDVDAAVDRYKRLNLPDPDEYDTTTPEEDDTFIDEDYYSEPGTVWKLYDVPEFTSPGPPTPPYRNRQTRYGIRGTYTRGNLQAEIEKLFKDNGINIVVTSGKRPAGAAGKAGSKSHHVKGNAVDIQPGKGETYETLRRKMIANPDIQDFFWANGLGVIDETDPNVMRRTGATGKHFHIGPDKWAVRTWDEWNGRKGDNSEAGWAKNMYASFRNAIKSRHSGLSDAERDRFAYVLTQQAAVESGWGKHGKGFNYGGHISDGKLMSYNSMQDFANAQVDLISKRWRVNSVTDLQDYVRALYHNSQYKYNASDTESEYYNKINGTSDRMRRYIGAAKYGGKFAAVRRLYAESFS